MGTQSNIERAGFFDSHLLIKVLALPICLHREAMHLQCLPIKFFTGTCYVDDPLLNIVYIYCMLFRSLYGHTMHVAATPA